MKLYRFAYSCYARKVQMLLDLLRRRCDIVDVPYGERTELATLTGGYIQVPVLVDDDGTVTVDSRAICERLLGGARAAALVPAPWQGPIWAYADWCDGPLEDLLFRLASPGIRARFARPADRALFTFIKERKFGRGCVDEWERDAPALAARARVWLQPTAETLTRQPFLFGAQPTLADAALYGQCVMLRYAAVMPATVAPVLGEWVDRLEAVSQGAVSGENGAP
jgi:glutathione S-transferase